MSVQITGTTVQQIQFALTLLAAFSVTAGLDTRILAEYAQVR